MGLMHHTLTCSELQGLVGTPHAPSLIDVCLADDIANDARLVPGARHMPHKAIWDVAKRRTQTHQSFVSICLKGQKLSQGATAILRMFGHKAQALEGGNVEWMSRGLPSISATAVVSHDRPWVLAASNDADAALFRWALHRWVAPNARCLWVAPEHVNEVAKRFDARPLLAKGRVLQRFDALGLMTPTYWHSRIRIIRAPAQLALC